MTTVDGGTIQSGIRVDLATLKQDVAKVEKIYDDLDFNVKQNSEEISKNIKIVENAQTAGALSQEEAINRIIIIREKALKALKDEVTTSGKLTTAQVTEIQKQEKELKELKTTQDSYTKSLDKTNDEIKENNTSLKDMAVQAGVVTAAIVAAKKAITIFGETEQSLANVRAVTNSTTEEFEALEQAALDAGESTRFTANQAADALFYLSSAGLSAEQSTAALGTTLELAGATGSDLAFTAQTLTSTMSQYGIEASEAGRISNVFAAANSNSQATLEKITNALRQAGPIAGQFGVSIEETTANLEALFNAGFKGEQSGTALRNILLTLADSTSTVSKAFVETGGSIEDIDPRIVGLTGAIEALNGSGIDLSQVFEKEAVGAVLSLSSASNDGEKGLRALEAAVTDTSEASRQYAVQNDTLFGELDKLKSAGSGLAITLTDQVAPILRGLISIATALVKAITGLPDLLKTLGVGAGAAAVGFTALTTALKFLGIVLGGSLGIVALVGAVVVALGAYAIKANAAKEVRLAAEFNDLAEALGKTGVALEEFTKKAVDADKELATLGAGGATANIERIGRVTEEIATKLGLSKKEVVEIALASKKVTTEFKTQLLEIKTQLIQQERQIKIYNERVKGEKILADFKEANAKAIKDQADLEAKTEKDRLQHIEDLSTARQTLNNLNEAGAITDKELLQEKISLRQDEYDALLEQAKASGDASAETVAALKKQADWIAVYQKSLDEITDAEAKVAEKRADAAKTTKLTYEEQIKLAEEYNELGLTTEAELLKEKVAISEDIIDGLKEQATEEGVLSEEIKANIKEQLGFISQYTASVKVAKEELAGLEDPSFLEELNLQITANLDVIVGDTIEKLGESLSSAVSASATQAEVLSETIDETKTKIEDLKDVESERIQEIADLESEINAEKQTNIKEQITEIEDAEISRLERIDEIQDSLGAKKLELIQIEEDAAIAAIDSKLSADLQNISDKEAAELEAAGYYVKTALEKLEDQLAAEEDLEEKAAISKEIEFQKIRDKYEAERVSATEQAEKDILKAADDAQAKRLTAEKDYGAVIDENAKKQSDFSDLEIELNTLKTVNRTTELQNLRDQIAESETLENQLAELKSISNETDISMAEDELVRLENQLVATENAGLALESLTEQLESIGSAIIKFSTGDYLGGITDILTGLFQPALEDIGTFLADNMTPELIDLGEKFKELSDEFGEVLGPLLLDMLILYEPLLSLMVQLLSLALKFVPLIDIFITLNPQLQLLLLYANLLTAGLEELNKFASYLTDKAQPVQDFFDTIINFLEAVTSLDFAGAGDIASSAASSITSIPGSVVSGAKKFFGFATGGIVPQQSGVPITGDQQVVRTNPGEMILTDDQQANLFDMINSGVQGSQSPAIIIQLDGQELADSTATYINNGLTELEK